MKLSESRLCLDCEEIHQDQRCPVCGSDAFTFLSRWIGTTAEGRPAVPATKPKPPEVAVYRRLIVADAVRPKAMRLLKQGSIGLAILSLARWGWRHARKRRGRGSDGGQTTTDG
jgi:hypothetical protein